MGEMITKPDANPIVIAAASLFIFGGLGYFMIGQKKKAMITWGIVVVCSVCLSWTGILPMVGFAMWMIATYDAYMLAGKLQAGESIGENENALEFLNMIFKD